MDNGSRTDIAPEPELEPVVCINCGAEFNHEPWPQTCPNCQQPIDLQAQFAYCRGHNAFTVGQEYVMKAYRGKRSKKDAIQVEKEGIQDYIQAYTALQRAFQGKLAESQRKLGIRMMAAMSQVLQYFGLISTLEASYWNTLLTEINSQEELTDLKEKLAANNNRGLIHYPKRWRWQNRQQQLENGLYKLDEKIKLLEKQIGFTERMNTRRRANEPLRQKSGSLPRQG
jgi:chromosome segregation ATPase